MPLINFFPISEAIVAIAMNGRAITYARPTKGPKSKLRPGPHLLPEASSPEGCVALCLSPYTIPSPPFLLSFQNIPHIPVPTLSEGKIKENWKKFLFHIGISSYPGKRGFVRRGR
jgi:hypothetical protein